MVPTRDLKNHNVKTEEFVRAVSEDMYKYETKILNHKQLPDALMLWSQRKDHAEVARHWGCGEHCIGENLRKVSMTAVLAAFMLHVLYRSLFLHRLATYLVLSDGYYIWHSQIRASSSNLRPYIIVGTCWRRG